MPDPVDYFGRIAAPDPNAFLRGFRDARLPIEARQQDQVNALNQAFAVQKLAALGQQVRENQSYQADVQAAISNPSPDAFRNLMLRYPAQHEPLKAAWDQYSEGEKRRNTEAAASVYAAISNGKPDLALSTLKARRQALQGAGQDTAETDTLITMLESGDPEQIKKAKGIAGMVLAVSAGPDKIASTLEALQGKDKSYTLSPGDKRFGEDNQVVAEVPDRPQFLVQPEGSTATPLNDAARTLGIASQQGARTGTAAAGGALDPHAFFKEFVAPHEGGYAAHDANGAPVNHGINQSANPGVDVKNLSEDDAADIFASKYFAKSGAASLPPALAAVHADTYFINPKRAEAFLKQSGGDPAKYMALRRAWMGNLVARDPGKYGKYQKAWANRNRDLEHYSSALSGGAAPAAGTRPGDPPGTIYGRPKPTASVLSAAEAQGMGLDPKKVYERRPDGTISAIGDATTADVDIPGNISLTGDAYLATVPKNLATQVKALSEGRLPLPSSFAMSKPYWQKLLQMTAQYDPTFDAANAKTRQKTRLEFTSGKAAANITSFNTVLGHLDSLDKSIDDLHNTRFPTYNALSNWLGTHVGDTRLQTAIKTFNANRNAVARELTRAFRQSGGNVADIKDFEHDLSAADSPEALHGVIRKYVDLLASRVNALGEQYNAGMGRSSDPINLLDPHAQRTMKRLSGEMGGGGSGQLPPGAKLLGKSKKNGRNIYQLPNGNKVYGP